MRCSFIYTIGTDICMTKNICIMSMVIADIDMVVQQVLPGQTWCLKLCLVSVWCSPLYNMMSVCPLLTSATAVSRTSN